MIKPTITSEQFAQLQTQVAELIYKSLMRQPTADWLAGRFEDHVSGEDNCATKAEIITDIKGIFSLE